MSTDIIQRVTSLASFLEEKDIDEWIVPKLISNYSQKIAILAVKAYGPSAQGITVAHLAFKERSKTELRSAVNTYLFKSEHWKTGRDLNTYLLTCLNRLADRIRWDYDAANKVNVPICPACKVMGNKEYLTTENKFWKCSYCTKETEILPEEINKLKNKSTITKADRNLIISFESKLKLHRSFSLHSRKGYRCKDCSRFIPESLNGAFGLSCPYEDCMFFGSIEKLDFMAHPVGLTRRSLISLQTPVSFNGSDKNKEIQDNFMAENIDPDVRIEISENFSLELKVLTQVLNEQIQSVKRTNSNTTIMQKILMYEAYQKMLEQYPEDMVSYLVHRKQSADFPIQSRIFQEYVRLMENALPYDVVRGNEVYNVVSLMDPNIQLFSGISEFDAVVKSDFSIPNNTTETYIGGLKLKNYGPCFIGLLINIVNKNTNQQIMDKVLNYTFVQINMKLNEIEPGTPVSVKHFRIPSHYEMGSLVYLQRVRRKIVDSIYYRLNGKKRVPGEDYKEVVNG